MWRVLSAVVPSSVEDEIASVLGGGSLGVEIAPAGPGASTVRVYLGAGDDEEARRRRAARVLAAHGVEASLVVDEVADARWVERWQAGLAPIPLGRRFVVLPGGKDDGTSAREPIVLVPGMAFGTGEHETTRMCAAALEELVAPGSHWLDIGTGTGILAIVAARLGAARVVAVDNDPEAAHVAREVVARNGGSVEVVEGSLEVADGSFDGVVANVQSSFFLREARALASILSTGGHLVVSGIVTDDAGEVADALGREGFSLDARRSDGPWACLILRRAG